MEQVVDMVNFRLSYIGSVDDNDTLRTYYSEVKSRLARPVSEVDDFFHPPCLSDNIESCLKERS